MPEQTLLLPKGTPKEVSAAQSLIPYKRNDSRSKYLGYMSCGFSDEEALYVLGLNLYWLELQRKEDIFCELEERVPELRKELSREYLGLDFYRNFRMVLEIDKRVLKKSLGMEQVEDPDTGEMVTAELSPFEQMYLLKLRGAYTPQQLQLLEAVATGNDKGLNFSQWVKDNQDKIVQYSRTDTVTVNAGTDA
ncbi:hypothetical protein LCGC14_2784890 [marine sediment metagenome]|uniref:Uncharacterized protein n=1 Tax=marine sediment metagenome TaxID=412755 RepID=A0A0F8ZEB3_9ZZZZ